MVDEKQKKRDIATIANFRDKNEKASWLRKKKNLEALADKVQVIQDEILQLTYQKQEIVDEIDAIRKSMTSDCIHPQDYLIHYDVYVKCRFCESKISIPRR
jgi:hypothetical protein